MPLIQIIYINKTIWLLYLRLYVSSKLFQGFHSITHLCFGAKKRAHARTHRPILDLKSYSSNVTIHRHYFVAPRALVRTVINSFLIHNIFLLLYRIEQNIKKKEENELTSEYDRKRTILYIKALCSHTKKERKKKTNHCEKLKTNYIKMDRKRRNPSC